MDEKKKKPALRFAGFSDDWEQRKLGEIVEVCSGRDYKHLEEGNIPVYGTGGYMLSVSNALSEDKDAIGIGRKGTIDNPYVLKAPFWTVDTLFYCIPKEKYDLDFVYGIYQNINWREMDESTGVPSLSKTAINNVEISVPLVEEQKKIGQYFRNLDHLITLHQRKLDKMKNFKKAMLEKMFPKSGEKYPEVRFSGFNDAWEQRKVGEIAFNTRGGGTPNTSNETYWDGNIPWIQSSDLIEGKLYNVEPRKYISKDGLNCSATQLVPAKSIAVVIRVGVGKLAFMPYSYATSQDFLSLCRLRTDPYFTVYGLYQMLHGELQAVQGTSIKGVTKDDLLLKLISVPNNLDEQKKIGDYFRRLDHLITLHQRKLEKLKNIKKSMLEKMFV